MCLFLEIWSQSILYSWWCRTFILWYASKYLQYSPVLLSCSYCFIDLVMTQGTKQHVSHFIRSNIRCWFFGLQICYLIFPHASSFIRQKKSMILCYVFYWQYKVSSLVELSAYLSHVILLRFPPNTHTHEEVEDMSEITNNGLQSVFTEDMFMEL